MKKTLLIFLWLISLIVLSKGVMAQANSCGIEGTPVYINTFGVGPGRTDDPNVLLHNYTTNPIIGDRNYAVTTSLGTGETYNQTDQRGHLDAGNPTIGSGSTNGRYLMINIDGPSSVNNAIYRINNVATVPGTTYRFRIDMAGLANNLTLAVPMLQLSIKDSNGNVLATANSSTIGMANDDVWRRLAMGFRATTTSVTLEIVNLQANSSGNDLGLDNIVFTPLSLCNADADGDGIPDWSDLDDDNDGILDNVECPGNNIVTNGTFTGGSGDWIFTQGWVANSDRMYIDANNITADLGKTINNLNYTNNYIPVKFTLGAQDGGNVGGSTASFEVYLNGILYARVINDDRRSARVNNVNITLFNGATSDFVPYSTNAPGYTFGVFTVNIPNGIVPGSAQLLFRAITALDDWWLDDVSIMAFTCDTDGDGIPNHLDLDSDNDGCPDALEGANSDLTTANLVNSAMPGGNTGATSGTYNLPVIQNLGNTVNTTTTSASYGVPIIAGTGQAMGTSQSATFQDIQCSTATGCTDALYLSLANTLYSINKSANPFTNSSVGVNQLGNYDAIGINPVDGRMYGILSGSNTLLVINANGTAINLGPITNLPTAVTYAAGEIDNLGNYYVKAAGTNTLFYKVNLSNRIATPVTLSASVALLDIAFRITDNLLYGVHSNGQFISINPATGAVTNIGSAPGAVSFGAMFGANTGEIYGVNNAGGFYQFNITNGNRTLIAGSPSTANNSDGAHCVTMPITFSTDLAVTKTDGTGTYLPGTNRVYTIVVTNRGPFGVLNAGVTDNVPVGIPAANVSYTAVASTGSTTAVSGTQTGAINDVVSIPANGTITYTVTVNVPLTFVGNLVNTVTVTPPANVTDSDLSNNTATDTDTSSCFGPDSDGDGIPDMCDLDDDNDGILDIDENCTPYLAQNVSGAWKGKTVSNLTVTAPTSQLQTLNQELIDGQNRFHINQSGATMRLATYGNMSYTYNFSTPVPANEIAFLIFNLDPNMNTALNATYQIRVNNGNSNGLFTSVYAGGSTYLNYDAQAGLATVGDKTLPDQRLLLKGFGTQLVSSITITGTGIFGSGTAGDLVAYSLFAYNECDTDGDGIPNRLDLDSDNDGCPDVIEGANTALNVGNLVNSAMPGGNTTATSGAYNQPITQNLGNTVNTTYGSTTYGVPTIAGAGQGVGQSQVTNPVLVSGTAAADQSIASGATAAAITLTGATGAIQWQVSADNLTFTNVASNGTTNTYSPGVLTATQYYRALVTSLGGCTAISNTVTIQICGNLPATGTPDSYTQTGISNLTGFGNGWPNNVPNGFIAVESKNKGFVITRVANTAAIANPVEGMLIYDNSANCVKLYYNSSWHCLAKDCNITIPSP